MGKESDFRAHIICVAFILLNQCVHGLYSFKLVCPPMPNEESVESDKISYNKWIETNNKNENFHGGIHG